MSYRTTAKLIFGVRVDDVITERVTRIAYEDLVTELTDAELVCDGDGRTGDFAEFFSFKTINKSEDGDPVLIPSGELVINPVRLAFIQEELDAFRIKHNITQELVPAWHLLTYTS